MSQKGSFVARIAPWVLTLGGIIGAIASITLTVEKIRLTSDPSYVPSCSIDQVLSCGSVMASAQSEAFGFPNSLIGVAAFPIATLIGIGMLLRTWLPRWVFQGLGAGTVFAIVFVHWLMFQSLYRINALCPYCMAVWAVTILIFWYTALYNLEAGNIPVPGRFRGAVTAIARLHYLVALWLLVIVALVLLHFADYFFG